MQFFATCPKGIEYLLARELGGLGVAEAREKPGGVAFSGSLRDGYAACLWLRLANRVLLQLEGFPAATPAALYDGVRTIDWAAHITTGATLAVAFTTRRSAINHSQFGAQKVKDAIVDQLRGATGERPTVQRTRPDVQVNVFVDRDQATLYIDLSGDSLHRRGYRESGAAAPLKENLAAAILIQAGWPALAHDGAALFDPLCGSGTLPIEAALIATDTAPGRLRNYFGFYGWAGHDAAVWEVLRTDAEARHRAGLERRLSIRGADRDPGAVRAARANVRRSGLAGIVEIDTAALTDGRPCGLAGLLVANPPYGERLGDEAELVPLYTNLGETLKTHFKGWRAAVFTGNPELGFRLGLRSRRPHRFYNGAIECRLLEFEIAPTQFLTPRELPPVATADRASRVAQQARTIMPGIPSPAAEMFANRLRKNLRATGRWAAREGIDCYRLYDADLPEYAVAVDLYGGDERRVHVQEYQAPTEVDESKADIRLSETLAVIATVLGVPADHVYLKVHEKQKGRAQYEKQAADGAFHVVPERACRFWVNFADYLDTGLFLDHRLVRDEIARRAAGKRFLNLFGYTGTATVYAALGGARATTTIDLSRTYLDWARRNLWLNGLAGDAHELLQADCLGWLDDLSAGPPRARTRYDLIFLNPPTFSNSKRMSGTFDVQRDHVELIGKATALLARDGLLMFSTNRRKFRLDATALPHLVIEDITKQTLPRDFARRPQGHHCWLFARRG